MSTQKHSQVTPAYLPTKEFATEQQISACLAVLRELQGYVHGPAPILFSETLPERPELDGGVKSAVTVAVMSVCDRIEKIMREEARWSVDSTLDLFKELAATQKAQQKFLEEQAASAHLIQLPQYLLKPELMSDGDQFFAVWGNRNLPGGRIIGRGKTPAAALGDFDDAFNRAPADQLQLIFEQNQTPPSETE